MPGFPALLALPIAIFDNPLLPAPLLLAGVGALGCGLVYVLGRMLFDLPGGRTAAGLTAIAPVRVGFSPVVLSETSFAVALIASLIGMAWWVRSDGHSVGRTSKSVPPRDIAMPDDASSRTRESSEDCRETELSPIPLLPKPDGLGSPSYGKAAVIGLAVGGLIALACYFRPSWILAGPLFGAGAVITSAQKGRAAVMAVCVLIGLVAALLPWGLRNQRVTGHFTLTTVWMGPSL